MNYQFSLFVKSSNLEETQYFLDDFHKFAVKYGVSISVKIVEKYLKIEEMYTSLIEVDESPLNNVKSMLKNIASKWEETSDDLLASKTIDDCEIYLPNLYVIVVYK